MTPERFYALALAKAAAWIGLVAFAVWRLTGRRELVRAYGLAHLAALGGGVLIDLVLLRTWLGSSLEFRQFVVVLPIGIFTVISLWICSWARPVHAADAFGAMLPIALWGTLVVFGWQKAEDWDVLGAWFVSAACGGADLVSRFGPRWATEREWLFRLAAYGGITAAVYALLPLFP